ncbi:DUF2804 domain-containing protein [Micromonospora carbonacea]|uniref:DUF2804 domain-containing protein n=1 Tax=Micromonospora carbonacea TaxID=47853 RepID=A0A7H8XLD7_9ACTN|nr:DUF2804 domain-containing protein [Micromonospora carbonacea]MBB5826311.1 hypothetical protein [Micromonospora carbonacea]QLD25853.1 DUF2804 domain-containing protein [Micromonospora carbonacea]
MTHEREITAPVDLCLPDGRLDPAAIGWTRRPLHRANLRGWGRTKRWEYWGVVTPAHVIGVVVSSLDYAGVHSLYVLDRATGEEVVTEAVVPLARGVELPERSGVGPVTARGPVTVDVDQRPDGTTLRATAGDVEVDLAMPLPAGHESLGVVVPWGQRRFQYTVKDVGRPVRGRLRVGGAWHDVPADGSFAVLDHGRGRWPYSIAWNWAAGSGPGRAVQLGGKWTDGTGSTENGLFVAGRLHKIGDELRWTYDRSDWLRPWRIAGDRVDVTLHPFHERAARTNLGVVANETHQCFGHFTGWAATDDGERIDLDGLVGWAEEARNRW